MKEEERREAGSLTDTVRSQMAEEVDSVVGM